MTNPKLGWQRATNTEFLPRPGHLYLLKIGGVLQHQVFEFTLSPEPGSGRYVWAQGTDGDDPPFNMETDEWLLLEETDQISTPSKKPKIDAGDLYQIEKYVNLDEGIEEVAPHLLEEGPLRWLVAQLKMSRGMILDELNRLVEESDG